MRGGCLTAAVGHSCSPWSGQPLPESPRASPCPKGSVSPSLPFPPSPLPQKFGPGTCVGLSLAACFYLLPWVAPLTHPGSPLTCTHPPRWRRRS